MVQPRREVTLVVPVLVVVGLIGCTRAPKPEFEYEDTVTTTSSGPTTTVASAPAMPAARGWVRSKDAPQ